MRRTFLLAGVLGLAVCAALVLLRPSVAQVDKEPDQDDPPATRTVQLPIGQVVLFSSGVGYFQREGKVEGDARVDLSFPVGDINDLLKSMVVRDLDGGQVSTVSYESNAPVERTLKSFAINLASNPGFGAILDQARGEKVEVVMQQPDGTQPGTLSGTVVGIETQKQAAGKDSTVEVEYLNLASSDGIRSLKLSQVQRVRFLNPIVDSEFRKALETLALSHDTQKKAVSINFQGEGRREVRVGYVIENPIWKTSYRLVLDKKEKPYLQGWAIVENATDEDWREVRMALVAGRPISFQMDLYTPLFVPRPTVELESLASLRPPTYSGALGATNGVSMDLEPANARKRATASPNLNWGGQLSNNNLTHGAVGLPSSPPSSEPAFVNALNDFNGYAGRTAVVESVAPAAKAAELGNFFQYALNKPVNVPRQKSAMLPIVGKEIETERVSIYNERVQAKFPLLGLKFKNTTGLHLMQGPITVFEGSNYAGDSRILDIQPKEERLLSYAIDLGTEVNPVSNADNGKIVSIKAVKGIVTTTTKVRETKTYTIKNRNEAERVVLIEHPVRNDFKLVGTDKPVETAADYYRFQVKVAPDKTETQTVTEERTIRQSHALGNLDDNNIRIFLSEPATSARVKEALKRVQTLRWALNKTQENIGELERQLKILTEDQARLRSNLREVPSDSEIGKRYLTKLNTQESVIEKYHADVKKLQATEIEQRMEFEQYLSNLTVE